jgi:hypothetical protein
MITNGYLALEELQQSLGASEFVGEADYEMAIEAASRWIDGHCSDTCASVIRHFWQETAPTQREYYPASGQLVNTGDFADATGVLVEVRATDGTWTPLDADKWQPEPLVRINGFPYTRITAAEYGVTFPQSLRSGVRVTARWGWAEVPKPVAQACQIIAVASMGGKAVVSMHDGYDVDSTGPTNPWAFAEMLLEPYLPPELAVTAMLPKGKLR